MMRIRIETGRTSDQEPLTRQSWARVKALVKKRDSAICQYCGQSAPDGEPDHVLPLAQGGADILTNLVWTCRACNRAKGGRTLREWIQGSTAPAPAIPAVLPVRIVDPITPEIQEWVDDVTAQMEADPSDD